LTSTWAFYLPNIFVLTAAAYIVFSKKSRVQQEERGHCNDEIHTSGTAYSLLNDVMKQEKFSIASA
jgi:hypothetical protein